MDAIGPFITVLFFGAIAFYVARSFRKKSSVAENNKQKTTIFRWKWWGWWAIGISFIFMFTMSAIVDPYRPPPPPSPEEIAAKQERIDSIDARTWAKIYVQKSLKAPTTAKFQDAADFGVAPAKDKKGKPLKDVWEVSGYVDAQNSFGAMLRNQWYVKLVKEGDKWVPIKIVMN